MADQEKASDEFEDWLNNSKEQTCGLWASAGFGKSWCTKHLVDEVIIKNSNYTPILASMTHSAVAVLADFVGRGAATLHSLMGWIPYVDKDTGEEGLSTPKMRDQNAEPRLSKGMIIIIDEAGLMGHDELRMLLEDLNESGARALFIGDHKQCYPVIKEGQRLCIPAYEHSRVKFELTIPKRVDEGDMIYKLSQKFRAAVDGAPQPRLKTLLNKDGSGKGVRHVDDIEELAYKAFAAGVRDGNTHNIKVLAYTNKRCLTLNRKIRKKITGLKDPTPVVGEEMVANTTIQSATGDVCLIRNNEKVIVVSVEKTSSFGLEGAFIQFHRLDDDQTEVEEVIFVPASPGKLTDRLKKLANDAKAFKANGFAIESSQAWRTFFSLKEGCADIRFTYAMTVNKSQGTTLKHVLVDLCDINSCRDYGQKTRMAYTATSRATDYCTIEGELL